VTDLEDWDLFFLNRARSRCGLFVDDDAWLARDFVLNNEVCRLERKLKSLNRRNDLLVGLVVDFFDLCVLAFNFYGVAFRLNCDFLHVLISKLEQAQELKRKERKKPLRSCLD